MLSICVLLVANLTLNFLAPHELNPFLVSCCRTAFLLPQGSSPAYIRRITCDIYFKLYACIDGKTDIIIDFFLAWVDINSYIRTNIIVFAVVITDIFSGYGQRIWDKVFSMKFLKVNLCRLERRSADNIVLKKQRRGHIVRISIIKKNYKKLKIANIRMGSTKYDLFDSQNISEWYHVMLTVSIQ